VLDARFSYKGENVVTTLDRVWGLIGYPKTIRVDNGSEFISRDMDFWPIKETSHWTSRARQTDRQRLYRGLQW
tara:strand:+ start:1985 stop:2203 length:219 start_codon:yes stop_codon:yes gene_type:complete